jgi:site-specific recombinase XerC
VADDGEAERVDDPAIAAYLQYLRVERRASSHTLRAYTRELERLRAALGPDQEPRWSQVAADDLRRFLASRAQEVERRSLARTVAVVRSFFAFLKRRGHLAANPAAVLGTPRFQRALPRYVAEPELERVFAAQPPPGDAAAARDTALLELLYGSGLRASEMVGLDWRDLDLEARRVHVRGGKGGKDRIVPFGRPAADALAALAAVTATGGETAPAAGSRAPAPGPVFRNRRGTRLAVRSVGRIVAAALRRAGVAVVNPHALRHSCATHLRDHAALHAREPRPPAQRLQALSPARLAR